MRRRTRSTGRPRRRSSGWSPHSAARRAAAARGRCGRCGPSAAQRPSTLRMTPSCAWSRSPRKNRSSSRAAPSPVSSRSGPAKRTDCCRTTTSSTVCSSSDRWWLDSRTVRPSAARSRRTAAQPVHAVGVQAVGRLVEQQQFGIRQQRGGQRQSLLHTGGIGLDPLVGAVGEADQIEHLGDPPSWDVQCPCPDRQVPESGGARRCADAVHGHADTAGSAGKFGVLAAEHPGGAGRRPGQAEQHPQRGGLAGAVTADQPDHPAGLDAQR